MSFQDRLRKAQQSEFIGRGGELALFCQNLEYPPDHDLRSPLFSVHGAGGMGKTFLLGRLSDAARDRRWLTAMVGDSSFEVVEAMSSIATQLEQQGAKLGRFTKLYEAYDKRRRSPEGGGARTFVKLATEMTKGTVDTLLPVAAPLTKAIDGQQVAETLVREDLRLVEAPVDVLTPAFLKGLCEVDRPLALFFDTYERTGQYLDEWLRSIFEGRYGDAPLDLVITVAGREPLDPHLWSPYLGVLTDMPLAAFTEVEVRQFLWHGAVRDETVIAEINKISRGLPLAVATLAKQRPSSPDSVKDTSQSLVRRFLQWVDDPAREDLALLAALPRKLDQDLVQVLVGGDATELYRWLHGQSFVTRDGGVCTYHEVVREPMLRLSRKMSPQRWSDTHSKLTKAYKERREGLGLTPRHGWEDAEWRNYLAEECYHRLCADPRGELGVVLGHAVRAAAEGVAVARRWAEVIAEAGTDSDTTVMLELGRQLRDALATDEGLGAYLDVLIHSPNLPTDKLHEAYYRRGWVEHEAGRSEAAVTFYNRSITLNPDYELAIAWRGEVYRRLERYQEALLDFDRALELKPDDAWDWLGRARTLAALGQLEEAVADVTRAVELKPDDFWYITHRGIMHKEQKCYEAALDDFTTAITLEPKNTWQLILRMHTYQGLGRYDEALADANQAVQLAPEEFRILSDRSDILYDMGRYEEALDDLATVLKSTPDDPWAHWKRGWSLRMLLRMDAAVDAFQQAANLASNPAAGLVGSGRTRLKQGRYAEALADFAAAVAADYSADTLGARGEAYRMLGRFNEAIADFTAAIALSPDDPWTLGHRAVTYRAAGQRQEAVDDLTRALELAPHDDSFAVERFMTCGITLAEGQDYQWVADLDATERDAHEGVRTARTWMVEAGLIEAERIPFRWDDNGIYQRRGTENSQRPTGVSFASGRIICYPMTGESVACPACGFRAWLRKDGLATPEWDKFVTPIYEWMTGGSIQRLCEACGAMAHLSDWNISGPWAFVHVALKFWNWPSLTQEFLNALSNRLGGHRLKLITGRR
ncbi:tetratricopeptide repeat protein [Streptosporangium sp. NPDC004379]|uniref:tetratricopeptide repeat protein n=1 Tax=Streptosporangium sp. NPDC004379 TaxID=3366189 RepID=UPI0036C9A336